MKLFFVRGAPAQKWESSLTWESRCQYFCYLHTTIPRKKAIKCLYAPSQLNASVAPQVHVCNQEVHGHQRRTQAGVAEVAPPPTGYVKPRDIDEVPRLLQEQKGEKRGEQRKRAAPPATGGGRVNVTVTAMRDLTAPYSEMLQSR